MSNQEQFISIHHDPNPISIILEGSAWQTVCIEPFTNCTSNTFGIKTNSFSRATELKILVLIIIPIYNKRISCINLWRIEITRICHKTPNEAIYTWTVYIRVNYIYSWIDSLGCKCQVFRDWFLFLTIDNTLFNSGIDNKKCCLKEIIQGLPGQRQLM